jgi:hypothetical protein
MKKIVVAFFALFIPLALSYAISAKDILQIADALRTGSITLACSGNGSSSGAAVEGYITNKTTRVLYIDVHLSAPLYLKNSGNGQDMVALEVYLASGEYSSLGSLEFIEIGTGTRTPIIFTSFCVDFESDNPESSERFTVASVPFGDSVMRVVNNAGAYMRSHPDEDSVAAVQIAIWLALGTSIEHIGDKFEFSDADVGLARTLLR